MKLRKFLLLISIVLFFPDPLFAGGGKEPVPGSNFAVTSSPIDIPGGKRIIYAYIADGKIYVNFYTQKTKQTTMKKTGGEAGQKSDQDAVQKTGYEAVQKTGQAAEQETEQEAGQKTGKIVEQGAEQKTGQAAEQETEQGAGQKTEIKGEQKNEQNAEQKNEQETEQNTEQNPRKKTAKKTDPQPKTFYEKNSSPKFITDISGDELKIQLIHDTLLVYDRPNIYRHTISIQDTGEENSIEIDSQSISVKAKSCLFYDNYCFFVESNGTVGRYNIADDKKNIFPGVKIDQVNIALMIIKKDLFLETISPVSDEWFKNITLENISKNGFTMTTANKDNLRRHLMINQRESQPKKRHDSIDGWLSYLKDAYNGIENKRGEIENEKTALKDEFDNQLGDFDEHKTLETAAPYRYGGTDNDIKYLAGFYNKIIDVYAMLKQKNILSPDSEKLLRENYYAIKKELSTLVTAKRENYEKNIRDLNAQLVQLDKDMEEIFQKSLGEIDSDSIPAKDSFDFIYLKDAKGHTEYVIMYKVLMQPSPADEFHGIGQNTGNMGFLDENIYVCDMGGISFYKPFTLELKTSLSNKIDPDGRETILYNVNPNNALVVTKTEKENKTFYRIRELGLDRETVVLKDPKIKVLGNKSNRLTKWAEPFYSAIIDAGNDKILYINEQKNKAGEKIIIKEDYIYLETFNGSGIISVCP